MSVDKLVDSTQLDADLTSVANAIRTKGGTSASLAFPADFVSAIAAIPSGGSNDNFADVCNGDSSTYESTEIKQIPSNVFRSITTLTALKIPNCKDLGSYALAGFRGTVVALPSFTGNVYNNGFWFNGSTITTLDLGGNTERIVAQAMNGASAFNNLILRKASIVTLNNVNAFTNTCFKSGGTGGTIYIPKSLYDHLGDNSSSDYKAASNWSTVNGYGTITWAKIEGSIYENAYADGTPISS